MTEKPDSNFEALMSALESQAEIIDDLRARSHGNTVGLQALTSAIKQMSAESQRMLINELDKALDDHGYPEDPYSREIVQNLRKIAESSPDLTPEQRRALFHSIPSHESDPHDPEKSK